MTLHPYPVEVLDGEDDDGTMPANVERLRESIVGHRIVSARKGRISENYGWRQHGLILTLDTGREVTLADTDDCCAYTQLNKFLLHPERVDHVITGVGTTDDYMRWHIYADVGDVLELDVEWSPGNAFYYGYGFDIEVRDL